MLCPVTTHAICSLIPVQYTSCVPLCFVTGHSSCAARQQFAVPRYETQRGTGIVFCRKQRLNRLFRNGAQELYVTIWKSIYLIRRNLCAPLRNRAFTPCAPLCFALCFVTGHSSCAPLWACARLSASSRCAVCTRRYSTHMPHPYVPRAHDVRIIHKKRRKPYLLDADAPFRTQTGNAEKSCLNESSIVTSAAELVCWVFGNWRLLCSRSTEEGTMRCRAAQELCPVTKHNGTQEVY